jgi:capsular polysaccharide biosynthesis protein
MRNADEVEAWVSEYGFQVIEPEKLSFPEQVKLFSTAESIVAQAGAALGNIIFAPQGCRIIILSAWSPFSIYYYFSNLASIFGQKCTYVLCEPDAQGSSEHPAHKGLKVDIQALKEAMEE